jgi:hypothetical protein
MKPLENNENDLEDGKLDKDREKTTRSNRVLKIHNQALLSGLAYCISSCSMILVNKFVLSSYGFNAGISLMLYQVIQCNWCSLYEIEILDFFFFLIDKNFVGFYFMPFNKMTGKQFLISTKLMTLKYTSVDAESYFSYYCVYIEFSRRDNNRTTNMEIG